MERCHLYLPLIDSSGERYAYAEVTLLDEATGQPITEPVYLTPTGGAPQKWPLLVNPAVINVWTDRPVRVTVQALLPGRATYTRTGVDIAPAPADTVRSERPLHIGSAAGLNGNALLAVSPDGSARWQVLDVLRFHNHEGNAPQSTVIGPLNPGDIYPGETFVGSATAGAQGEDATAIGRLAQPDGPDALAAGRQAKAAAEGVAVGAAADAGESSVALGARAVASHGEQVVLGRDGSAAAAGDGAVVLGAQTAAAAGDSTKVGARARLLEDGTVVLGEGELPDLSWLGGEPHIALLGNTVIPHYLAPQQDVVLAGPSSTLGLFGAAGTTRPMVSTAGLAANAPGRAALLSLLDALDKLGLVYLLDGAIDDELADWTKVFAHDANTGLETGDDGSKAGDTTRAKRNDVGPATITYRRTAGVRDFALRAFTWWQDWNPDNHAAEITAAVSPDNAAWTPVPLAWEPLVPTADDWNVTWARNARPIPAGMQYVRITLDLNSQAWTPQLGRVIVR
ncbi:hypothetical protein ACPCSE_29785 [Streptomyces cellulosae]